MSDAIDLERLRDLFSDDEPALFELLRATANESRLVYQRLSKAIFDHDVSAAAAAAHELKGFAGNVGAASVAELAAHVESGLSHSHLPDAASACLALGGEVDRVIAFIADCLPSGEVSAA